MAKKMTIQEKYNKVVSEYNNLESKCKHKRQEMLKLRRQLSNPSLIVDERVDEILLKDGKS